ncbi:MAG: YkgJ family cysteine cluster protein [bacterium]
MSNLSNDVDNLKTKYREIFSRTIEEFNQRVEKIKPQEFLKFLNEDILKEIYEQKLKILESRKKISCTGCAACCKLACSEFSYDELRQKAQNGDNFATQFISVFVPHDTEVEAEKIYPEYFELLKNKAEDEKVYFYHCPKVTEDNRCPDYENRPQICRDFPDNPIGFLPKTCGYTKWKEKVEEQSLKLHSLLEIIEFYKSKIS